MKNMPKTVDPIASNLNSMKKSGQLKPTMKFRVSVGHDYMDEDPSWRKDEAKRLRKEIKEMEDRLTSMTDKDAAREMRKALKWELTTKRARHAEHKTYLDAAKDDSEGADD